jgi:hypothetical protein
VTEDRQAWLTGRRGNWPGQSREQTCEGEILSRLRRTTGLQVLIWTTLRCANRLRWEPPVLATCRDAVTVASAGHPVNDVSVPALHSHYDDQATFRSFAAPVRKRTCRTPGALRRRSAAWMA